MTCHRAALSMLRSLDSCQEQASHQRGDHDDVPHAWHAAKVLLVQHTPANSCKLNDGKAALRSHRGSHASCRARACSTESALTCPQGPTGMKALITWTPT